MFDLKEMDYNKKTGIRINLERNMKIILSAYNVPIYISRIIQRFFFNLKKEKREIMGME